jgi:hypothetical protein
MAAFPVLRVMLLLICFSIFSVSSSPESASQGVQAVDSEQQIAVDPTSAGEFADCAFQVLFDETQKQKRYLRYPARCRGSDAQ